MSGVHPEVKAILQPLAGHDRSAAEHGDGQAQDRVSVDFQRELFTDPSRGQAEHGNLVVSQFLDGHILSEPRGAMPAFSHQEPRVSSSSIHTCLTVDYAEVQRLYRADLSS